MPIDKWNIHILNSIFATLSLCVMFVAIFKYFTEDNLPNIVKQIFHYGKHCHKGPKVLFISRMEVPKAWFSHFYIFALIWSTFSMFLFLHVSVLNNAVPIYIEALFEFMTGGSENRKVLNDTSSAFIALVLMSLQCWRRCYESNFVQIYSHSSKINIFFYLLGYLHYFGIMIVILANTEGFVQGTLSTPVDLMQTSIIQRFCIALFIFSWWHQYRSNLILVKLRKNSKNEKVATEEHFLPRGGFFELISSPHMLFEVMMYISLLGFMANNVTWWLIVLWVSGNQVFVANCTHRWYLEHFKDYPTNWKVIIPFIL